MSERACTWPHGWLTAEEEMELTAAIAAHRPFIDAMGRKLGKVDEQLTSDLNQTALILLWAWGTERILATEARTVRSAIVKEMMELLRAEYHAGGWAVGRKNVHVVPGSLIKREDP